MQKTDSSQYLFQKFRRKLKKDRLILLIYFIIHYRKYIFEKSFYPEKEHKSKIHIFCEFISHILKHGEIDESYFVLGIDVKGVKYDDYLSYEQYKKRRDRLNVIRRDCYEDAEPANYSCILRDKSLFSIFGHYWGFPVVRDLAKVINNKIVDSEYSSIEDLLIANHHVFAKPIDGQKGKSVYGMDMIDNELYVNGKRYSVSDAVKLIEKKSELHDMLLQNRIIQHPDVMALHKESVNTLRVVTINHLHSSNPEEVILVGSELRVGSGGRHTDNVSAGGLKIAVNEDGSLAEYGYYDKEHGTKTRIHPDSGLEFRGIMLPYYDETIQLCKKFHSKLKEIHLIGWDIAITENGPVFIEGNESCGTDFQVMFGPMRKYYDKFLPYQKCYDRYFFNP